jgi:hypothetical protein
MAVFRKIGLTVHYFGVGMGREREEREESYSIVTPE